MSSHLREKVVLISGAAGGIGVALSTAAARAGATVVCIDIDRAGVHSVASAIGTAATAVELDVADADAVTVAVRSIAAGFGRIDVLLANAGGGAAAPVPRH
jgi:NAD(P)-dependent dehydrogenase (short-subunit alcohol dehydrogenase family)